MELKMYGNKEVPKFCGKCGAKMNKRETDLGFNTQTGSPLTGTILYCVSFGSLHTTYEFSEEGNEIIPRY